MGETAHRLIRLAQSIPILALIVHRPIRKKSLLRPWRTVRFGLIDPRRGLWGGDHCWEWWSLRMRRHGRDGFGAATNELFVALYHAIADCAARTPLSSWESQGAERASSAKSSQKGWVRNSWTVTTCILWPPGGRSMTLSCQRWLRKIGSRLASRRGHIVIACSALKRSYREIIRHEAPATFFVHLTGSPALLHARMSHRAGHFMPATLLQSQLDTIERLSADEEGTELDISEAPDVVAAAAALWLRDRTAVSAGL